MHIIHFYFIKYKWNDSYITHIIHSIKLWTN
jgi:hypothetical protein